MDGEATAYANDTAQLAAIQSPEEVEKKIKRNREREREEERRKVPRHESRDGCDLKAPDLKTALASSTHLLPLLFPPFFFSSSSLPPLINSVPRSLFMSG